VHPSAIGAGEAVTITVNFDDDTMVQDASCLSGRLTVGPDDFLLFDEIVNVCYVSEPQPPPAAWDPDNLTVEYTVETARGPSPFIRWNIGGVGVPTALGREWDMATWTLRVTNDDPTYDTPNMNLYAELDNLFETFISSYPYQVQLFDAFVTAPTVGTYGYDPANPWMGTPVITWTGSLAVGESFEMSWTGYMDEDMAQYDDHLSLVYDPDDFWGTGGVWDGAAAADVYYRSFRTTGSYKMADVSGVYPGDTVNYTVVLENPSSVDTNVFVSDELDPDFTFVSATNGATYDAAEHRVTWGGMLSGSTLVSQTFDVQVTVADEADIGYIDNCADIYLKLDDDWWSTYCDSIYVQPSAYVDVVKTVDRINGFPEDLLNYTIVMENAGPLAASNGVLTDVIPSYATVVPNSLGINMGTGQTVQLPARFWDEDEGVLFFFNDTATTEIYTITFQATIDADAPEEWAIINPAEFTADNAMWTYDSALTEVFGFRYIYMPLVLRDS
jgi:uncharacterized repeat protein (TIGR01451 family)